MGGVIDDECARTGNALNLGIECGGSIRSRMDKSSRPLLVLGRLKSLHIDDDSRIIPKAIEAAKNDTSQCMQEPVRILVNTDARGYNTA